MDGLRAATWPAHQRLERRIDFRSRLASVASYRTHLESMWGFYAELEPRLRAVIYPKHLADYEQRLKLPLLERDLRSLGLADAALGQLPRCTLALQCADPAAAFGSAYVLEGATLGGRSLMPSVEARLGFSASHGAAFLASYGAAVGEMWRSFAGALERYCSGAQQQARAASAAIETFTQLEAWLCGANV